MTTARDNLIDWLRDAHAMEEQAISLLKAQIDRLENYPEALPRLRQHLAETENQRKQIEMCLKQLGSDTSTLKDVTMKLAANVQGLLHALTTDEVLKHELASYAFEQFEAASYHMLAAAARQAGEEEVARVCDTIEKQELAMADWLWQQLPVLTQKYLLRDQEGLEAKR